jgi:hypothetical protein
MLGILLGRGCCDAKERRRAERARIDAPGELLAVPSDVYSRPMPVDVRDVSATGVGVVHDQPLPLGQKYVVKQDLLPAKGPQIFTVVRSETTPDGRYSVGLHASNLLDPLRGEVKNLDHQNIGSETKRTILAVTASILFLAALAALMLY